MNIYSFHCDVNMGHEDWASVDGYNRKQDDATWFVRQDLEACQLPDEERDDEQHDHQDGGDEEDLTLLFRGCGDGTQPP
jgi:hypothetical protein